MGRHFEKVSIAYVIKASAFLVITCCIRLNMQSVGLKLFMIFTKNTLCLYYTIL